MEPNKATSRFNLNIKAAAEIVEKGLRAPNKISTCPHSNIRRTL
ncbi:MAG: hypothetical protein JWQ23_1862, partial [Herminiimonas sp.]|nr:hypothetical protein [Herminiimonas sp.]